MYRTPVKNIKLLTFNDLDDGLTSIMKMILNISPSLEPICRFVGDRQRGGSSDRTAGGTIGGSHRLIGNTDSP